LLKNIVKEDPSILIDLFYHINGRYKYDPLSASYLISLLNQATAHEGRILEIGCGAGSTLLGLAEAGFRCWGLDNDIHMLRKLVERGGKSVPLICADWVNLKNIFSPNHFDALICWGNSLIYTQNWGEENIEPTLASSEIDETLQGAYDCLTSGGKIIIESIGEAEENIDILYRDDFSKGDLREEIVWHVEHDKDRKIRRMVSERKESGDFGSYIFQTEFVGYLLSPLDLIARFNAAGFENVKAIKRAHSPYDIFIGEKA
jgi:SAM-dependent methyltransferase